MKSPKRYTVYTRHDEDRADNAHQVTTHRDTFTVTGDKIVFHNRMLAEQSDPGAHEIEFPMDITRVVLDNRQAWPEPFNKKTDACVLLQMRRLKTGVDLAASAHRRGVENRFETKRTRVVFHGVTWKTEDAVVLDAQIQDHFKAHFAPDRWQLVQYDRGESV